MKEIVIKYQKLVIAISPGKEIFANLILMNAEMMLKIAIMVENVSIRKVLLNVIVKALDTVEEDAMMMLMNVLRNLA